MVIDARMYDPDLGLGGRVGYHWYEPTIKIIYDEHEKQLADYATMERLIEMRINAGLRKSDLVRRLNMPHTTLYRWERGIERCSTETRLAWFKVCSDAESELQSWLTLGAQLARVRADLTIRRLATLMGEKERDVRLWDLAGYPNDDVQRRWAAVCRNEYVRKQFEQSGDHE